MSKRTLGALLAGLLVLTLAVVGCAATQMVAGQPRSLVQPTRTPLPTWTPEPGRVVVATPTLDVTRFPNLVVPTAPAVDATPQMLVPGAAQSLVLPPAANGAQGAQTVVVIIVTATPPPPVIVEVQRTDGDGAPEALPAATATITPTPPPPVMIQVTTDKANVRQGPGTTYPVVTRLDKDTTVTVVGRNRAGDWWKICCVNGMDVWISADVTRVEGPVWTVVEVMNIPPSPPPPPTASPPGTPAPTPTDAWPFRLEGVTETYPLGQNLFRVSAVIYDGRTPLWGYRLRIRKTSTSKEWLSDGSEAYWKFETIQWADKDRNIPQVDVKRNVKWDSNSVQVPMDDDVWEVTVTDGGGQPLSQPVQIRTSAGNSEWYYLVFTSRP